MKAIIRTNIAGTGTYGDLRRPYTAYQLVQYSFIKLDDTTCITRVSGTPAQIATIKADAAITVLTDDDAQIIIKSKYPDSDLENIDIADNEIDEIAKAQGLGPKLRADIQMPTRGKQLLQDQESYLMSFISKKMEFTEDWWNKEAKNGKWATGKELEDSVKDGCGEAHEFILSRIRTKHLKHTVACDVPSKIAHDITCLLVPNIALKDRKDFTLEAAQAQMYLPCSICVPFV